MIQSLVHWIYCLDIHILVWLIAIFTSFFAIAYYRVSNKKFCNMTLVLLLIVSVFAVLYTTLLSRSVHEDADAFSLIPFESYISVINGGNVENLRSNFMNVVLFYPSALIFALVLPKKCSRLLRVVTVTVLFTILSCGIEYIQYIYALGKPEIDDVIHNTVGALVGAVVGVQIAKLKQES